MAEKLLVNDFVFNFGVLAAEAGEMVSPVVAIAATTARLPILLSFRMRMLPTPTFLRTATRRVISPQGVYPGRGEPTHQVEKCVDSPTI
jgi:hypothetical protein